MADARMQRSLLLFKPDALVKDRPGVEAGRRAIARHGLCVRHEFRRVLRPDDVACLWPRSTDAENPLQSSLLRTYLVGASVLIWIVDGPEAITACRVTKRELRTRYAKSTFGNCVHAPENDVEAAQQLPQLGFASRSGGVGSSATRTLGAQGDFPRASEFDGAASRLWQKIAKGGWEAVRHRVEGTGPARVFLRVDGVNSFDDVFRSLREVFPSWSTERTIEAILHADRKRAWSDSADHACVELARGAPTEMEAIAARLSKRRLNASLVAEKA